MFGQAHPPYLRLLGIVVAVSVVMVLPAAGRGNPSGTAGALRLENAQLAAKSRSAVLDLYSLDVQLTTARAHLASLQAQLRGLRAERATLKHELQIAQAGEQISGRQLTIRLRQLYDQGSVSTIDVVFGAKSLTDAITQLDNVNRMASLNDEVLAQLRTAHSRLRTASRHLKIRTAELESTVRAAAATEASLSRARAARAAYIESLASRLNLNSAQITSLERQASAAETKSQTLTASAAPAVIAGPLEPAAGQAPGPSLSGKRTLTATISGYALPGRTATGIPVGWGVAAVDPRVIPLGTHILVPGYGEAVAADVGGAIVGTRIDLWFPSLAQARAWGLRTVTIVIR